MDKALVESLPSLTHALMERHFMSFVHTIFHFNELHDSILRFDERKCVPVHVLSPYTDHYPHLFMPPSWTCKEMERERGAGAQSQSRTHTRGVCGFVTPV